MFKALQGELLSSLSHKSRTVGKKLSVYDLVRHWGGVKNLGFLTMYSFISGYIDVSTSFYKKSMSGDSDEEVALWLLTSLCTSAKREVEVAL
jgi:hypothetical protein